MTTEDTTAVASPQAGAARIRGYDIVRVALAAILLVAAALKTHQIATRPIVGTSRSTNR